MVTILLATRHSTVASRGLNRMSHPSPSTNCIFAPNNISNNIIAIRRPGAPSKSVGVRFDFPVPMLW